MRFFEYAIGEKNIFNMIQSIILNTNKYHIFYNITLLCYRTKYNM